MGSWSLTAGWLPWVVRVGGVAAVLLLLANRSRRFWTRLVPIALGAAAIAVAAVDLFVEVVWHPFPDRIPVNNLVWTWAGLAALVLAALRLRGSGWPIRGAFAAGAAVLVLVAAVQVNAYWGMYPTLHSLNTALHPPATKALLTPGPSVPDPTGPPGRRLLDTWRPPATMPATGTISKVHIPGTASGFPARDAYVYQPPAYQLSPRPQLPVIVLLAGQPGAPENWITVLGLADILDGFARTHKGLAPVAVVPDDLGSTTGNPLCVDSRLGNVETYLARDVPLWIRANLQVGTDRRDWFIGGYSHGGTCALQLAVRAPDVYGGFVDISGQREPTLGSRTATLHAAFGGSATAFAKVNPLDILKTTRFPTTSAFLTAGTGDTVYLPQQNEVRAACQAAGMNVQWLELPGGHNLTVWREAARQAIPWLATQAGLTTP